MVGKLDAEVLERLRQDGGATLPAALATLLARTTPARLATIEHGVDVGDLERVAKAAHSLRSAAANLGATDLANAAQVLELLATMNRDCQTAALAVKACWLDIAEEVRRLSALDPQS